MSSDKKAAKRRQLQDMAETARPASDLISQSGAASTHGLPGGCPITPLGLAGDQRFYLDAEQQLIALAAKEHTRLQINGLFGQKHEFVYSVKEWTRRNEDGMVTGWKPERVAEALMRACGIAGVWDPNQRERGRGAWRGDDGELILHVGDKVLIFGLFDPWHLRIVRPAGLVGRYVYPAGERTAAPAERDDDGPDAAETVLALFDSWTWRRPDLDPVLLFGWLAAAMIGGALKWRPACWLTGGKGTGKSTLQKAIVHLLGGNILALADTTAAAIWQTLQHQTLPVAVDELEAQEDNRRAMDVIKLARIAASGGKMARGSERHTAVEFILQSCFLFSSVLVPPLGGPDRSRIAILELDDLPPTSPEPNIDPQILARLGAQIRRRLVMGWPRWEKTLEFYRSQLNAEGHTKRGADQFGTLLAAADLALFGAKEDAASATDWIGRFQAANLDEASDDSRDEEQCLQHLLGSPLDVHRNGARVNCGEWINRAASRTPDYDDHRGANKLLQGYGMRVETMRPLHPGGKTTVWVVIATNHTGLATLFERSRWATPRGITGVWVQSLRRLQGAERSSSTLYFGGAISRAILLPLRLIPEPDLEDQKPIFDAQMR